MGISLSQLFCKVYSTTNRIPHGMIVRCVLPVKTRMFNSNLISAALNNEQRVCQYLQHRLPHYLIVSNGCATLVEASKAIEADKVMRN